MNIFIKKISTKAISGILLSVLSFGLIPSFALATPNLEVSIIIGVKNHATVQVIENYYGVDLQPVYTTSDSKLALTFKTTGSIDLISELQMHDGVDYAEINSTVSALAISTSDPFFTLSSTDEDRQWYLNKTRVTDAWNVTKGDSSIIVAVVDTGIHASHIELNDGRVMAGFNAITGQPIFSNSNSDDNGHGTAVAGIIGAIPNNQRGIAGIAWDVRIMPIKSLQADGVGELSAVAAGIVWAVDNGASIVNLSLGGSSFINGRVLADAITYAYERGVFIVAAAGNDHRQLGVNLDQHPSYPVCADNGKNMVFGVAATDINDRRAEFSDYGFNCIDISAPGKRILTTAFLPEDPSDNILIYASGTSVAAPMISGIAALIKSANPEFNNVDIQNAITRTADDIYPLNQNSCAQTSCNGFLGKGRVNAFAAIRPEPIPNAGMVRENSTGNIYIVVGGVKRLVTSFVFNQRGFKASNVVSEVGGQLRSYATGTALLPLEGTLIKTQSNPTVYVVNGESIRPVSYATFISRGYNFADILTVPESEIVNFPLGAWYWPPDGTAIMVEGEPLVYVMDKNIARPTTYFAFQQRGLSFARIIKISLGEFLTLPISSDGFWLTPPEGTLIKSESNETVYLIDGGMRRALSFHAFSVRKYSFSNIKIIPQAEIEVIASGPDINN